MRVLIVIGLLVAACDPHDPPVEESASRIFTHEAHGGLGCFACHAMHGERPTQSFLIPEFNCGNCHEEQ